MLKIIIKGKGKLDSSKNRAFFVKHITQFTI